MEYRRMGDTCWVRIDRGEEVLSALRAVCATEGILLAEVSGIGAVDEAELGLYDVGQRRFLKQKLEMPLELTSLLGTVTAQDGMPYLHLHGTVCDAQLRTYGGHIVSLRVSATSEVLLRILPGQVGRRYDEETGLNIFDFT